jgi:hypothetical protein
MSEDNTLHVAPTADLVEHDTSTDQPDCVCVPRVEHVERADGSDGWIMIHHSLDGRESEES